MKKIILKIMIIGAMMGLVGCGKTSGEEVKTEEFFLGENLQTAITELALKYDTFDASLTKEEYYPTVFISSFCQNSRVTFDYLEEITKEGNGILSEEQVEYIQHSLTGQEVELGNYIGEEGLDAYQTTSGLGFGEIVSYEAEVNGDEVNLVAQLEFFKEGNLEGQNPDKLYELDVVLIKNEKSCFDGYSIKSLSKKDVTPVIKGDGEEHIFCGMDMGIEENGVFILECYGGDDEVVYGTHIEIDLSSNPELADLVRENPGQELEVTYVWENTMTAPVERVIPLDVKVCAD